MGKKTPPHDDNFPNAGESGVGRRAAGGAGGGAAGGARQNRGVPGRRTWFEPTRPLDLALTLGRLRRGPHDRCLRLAPADAVRATRTAGGPATVEIAVRGGRVEATAWGPGADHALDGLPDLLGEHDRPDDLVTDHPVVRDLQVRLAGLRLGRGAPVVEVMVAVVLEQKVQGIEAYRSYAALVDRFGEPAPGPHPGLRLPPDPERLAALRYPSYHPAGIERRRAEIIRTVASRAAALERLAREGTAALEARATALPGVGPWTAAETAATALGGADTVVTGDFGLPGLVAWNLAGERRADDARMLELLEPFRPQRGRVLRLLRAGGRTPERRAPRAAVRDIAPL